MGCFPSRPKDTIAASIVVHDHEYREMKQAPGTCYCHRGASSLDSRLHKPQLSTFTSSKSLISSFSQASTLRHSRLSPSSRPPTPPPKDDFLSHQRLTELSHQQSDITLLITALTSSLNQYATLLSLTQTQTISSLSEILTFLPSGSAKINLISLRASISALQEQKMSVLSQMLTPAIDELPSLWEEFCSLPLQEQVLTARKLEGTSAPMRIFRVLREIRVGCEAHLELDSKIQQRVNACFEDLLREINCLQPSGVGLGSTGDVGLKWRVFGLLTGSRMEKLQGGVGEVMEGRNGLSGLFLGFVEELGELEGV
ncbi:unnamed protein product [Sphagnum balticum]